MSPGQPLDPIGASPIGYTSLGAVRRLRDREDDSFSVEAEPCDGCDVPVYVGSAPRPQAEPSELVEKYLADIINRSPDPLRHLGEWLSRKLDEDDWKAAERFVLGAMESIASPAAPKAETGNINEGESETRWWSPPDSFGASWLTNGAGLHPQTVNLVVRFARALAAKLAAAEVKYGYSDGWLSPNWMDECRAKLLEHVAKGDPIDVAAYCAFLWHHGASTAAAKPVYRIPPLNETVEEILGRPNFTCAHIARILRIGGAFIAPKAEAEQAAVIHFLLGQYIEHGDDWFGKANDALREMGKKGAAGKGDPV